MNITKDRSIETHHHRRTLEIKNGPMMSTKKNIQGKKYEFQVTHIVVSWQHGMKPEQITFHGRDATLFYKRTYKWSERPEWVKKLL